MAPASDNVAIAGPRRRGGNPSGVAGLNDAL